jgi:hypothetical protein
MTTIYEKHRASFNSVSAYIILNKQGDRVATIAFKYPRDGAGRLYAYVHVLGTEMVRGYASGGGYDKATAAVSSAIPKIKDGLDLNQKSEAWVIQYDTLRSALAKDNGWHWYQAAEQADFTVLQAV